MLHRMQSRTFKMVDIGEALSLWSAQGATLTPHLPEMDDLTSPEGQRHPPVRVSSTLAWSWCWQPDPLMTDSLDLGVRGVPPRNLLTTLKVRAHRGLM